MRALVARARSKAADLLWMCRAGGGMRPRTAIVLFNAMVRPVLEYCAVLWEGCISAGLAREVEQVQSRYLRAVSGVHKKGMGISNDFLRAEHGVECLSARRAKLKVGFWRRLQTVDPQRVLHAVTTVRVAHVRAGGAGIGARSVFNSFRDSLNGSGLGQYWDDPTSAVANFNQEEWKQYTYDTIDELQDRGRGQRMTTSVTAELYNRVKFWGENDPGHSAYTGEVGRLGFRVPEPYLDDRVSPAASVRLKLLARGGALPLMDRVGRERGWPRRSRICLMCGTGEVEDTRHVFLDCPAYAAERTEMEDRVAHVAVRQGMLPSDAKHYQELDDDDRMLVLLGRRLGNAKVEAAVDLIVKMFLSKVWSIRDVVRVALNGMLRRSDS